MEYTENHFNKSILLHKNLYPMKTTFSIIVFKSILLFICCNTILAQKSLNQEFEKSVSRSINSFIDTINAKRSESSITQHRVFIIYFHELDIEEKSFIFSISYIMNSSELQDMNSSYYYKYRDNFAVVRFNNNIKNKQIVMFKLLNKESRNEIEKKLFDNSKPYNFITGVSEAAVYKFKNTKIQVKFFEKYEKLPDSLFIFDNEYIKNLNDSVRKHDMKR